MSWGTYPPGYVGMIPGVMDNWTLVKLGNTHTCNDRTWKIIIVDFVALYLLKHLKQWVPYAFIHFGNLPGFSLPSSNPITSGLNLSTSKQILYQLEPMIRHGYEMVIMSF